MKPHQILTFLISVFLVLLILAVFFPDNGLKISEHFSLRFFRPTEFLAADTVEYTDISAILTNSSAGDDVPEDMPVSSTAMISEPENVIPPDTVRADADSLKKITRLIELPPDNPEVLFPFFRQLSNIRKNHRLVRVLHYGDSQIEADRMTGFIRHKLQLKFGGSGCGLIPVVPLYNGKMSIRQSFSGTWDRYTGFVNQDSTLGHKRYGALFSFARFRASDSLHTADALLTFSPSPIGYRSSRSFNRFSIYLGGKSEDASMKVIADDSLLDTLTISPGKLYHRYTWKTNTTPKHLSFEFSGHNSPEIYGITLDNSWGVAVDNIPLRGSSGLIFSKVDTVLLKRMYTDLNVGLILLQFGGNVIPYLKDDYDYYERLYKRELGVIKRMLPGTPVIVIGPSDMSVKEDGRYTTYPNLEPIRNVLRKAALESGCAFWDMYSAMGGKNSMPSWVFADPPLAISDFVHFNPRGARIIGEMFYNAFIYDYDQWLEHTYTYAQNR